jgi:hypothetical protein
MNQMKLSAVSFDRYTKQPRRAAFRRDEPRGALERVYRPQLIRHRFVAHAAIRTA